MSHRPPARSGRHARLCPGCFRPPGAGPRFAAQHQDQRRCQVRADQQRGGQLGHHHHRRRHPASRVPDAWPCARRHPGLLRQLRPQLRLPRRPRVQPPQRLQQPHPDPAGWERRQRGQLRRRARGYRSRRSHEQPRADRDRPRPRLRALRHGGHFRGGEPRDQGRRRAAGRPRCGARRELRRARRLARLPWRAPFRPGPQLRGHLGRFRRAGPFLPRVRRAREQLRRRPQYRLGAALVRQRRARRGRIDPPRPLFVAHQGDSRPARSRPTSWARPARLAMPTDSWS